MASGLERASTGQARLLVPVGLLLASLAVYGRTLTYPFVLDDSSVIVNNSFLQALRNPLVLFVSDYSRGTGFGPGYFRPLMMFTFWLQGGLLGWTPGHLHLVNILLHAATAWALYLTARALDCGSQGALFGALLFLVFPPGHESVGSIVGRCDILATLFFLLGCRALFLWRAGTVGLARTCAAVFGLGLLAMLGKENAATYPVAIGATAGFFHLGRRHQGREQPAVHLKESLAIGGSAFVALLVYLTLRFIAVGGIAMPAQSLQQSPNPVVALAQPERTYAALYGTGRMLLTILWPTPMSAPRDFAPGHPFPLSGLFDPGVAVPAAVLLLLAAGLTRLFLKGRVLALPVFLFLLNLVPVSNLVVLAATFIAERFLYLPFSGAAIAAALGWDFASARLVERPQRWAAMVLLVVALLTLWGCVASHRAADWRSEEAVVSRWPSQFPWATMGWNHLGVADFQKGDLPAARRDFETSLNLDPDNAVVLGQLGSVLSRLGDWDGAARRLERAVALMPSDPANRIELSRALLRLGKKQDALEQAQAAYALKPTNLAALQALSIALLENQRFDEAAWHWQRLVEADPGSLPAYNALLLCLYRLSRWDEAARAADGAARHFPREPLFDLWIARLAMRQGRVEDAIARLAVARQKNAPVARWINEVDDLKPLRGDSRVQALIESP